ncbi:hypothetical protein [Mesorhizobium sp. KR1-2]
MAKGQLRSNKEPRKPKKDAKKRAVAVAPASLQPVHALRLKDKK